jgi:uncharacterized protein (DUF1697 family)
MALVVFLRGVNVGGHRTFKPSALARDLAPLDVVNIGAAGTFVVRTPIGQARLSAEFARRLPFDTHIAICEGRDILRLLARNCFAGQPVRPDVVRFVSVLAKRPRARPSLPLTAPAKGRWLVKLLERDGRLVIGLYRRHMKTIRYLDTPTEVFGVPATTRNWNTLGAIAKVLDARRRT